MDAVPV
jgi:hypothetical protein